MNSPYTPLNEKQVVGAVVEWLRAQGHSEVHAVDVGATGIDIVAGPSATHPGWIIEAKGAIATRQTEKSRPYNTGATFHALANAFTTAAWWRTSDRPDGRAVAFALPEYPNYRLHLDRLLPACVDLGITVFVVHQNGLVELQGALPAVP